MKGHKYDKTNTRTGEVICIKYKLTQCANQKTQSSDWMKVPFRREYN